MSKNFELMQQAGLDQSFARSAPYARRTSRFRRAGVFETDTGSKKAHIWTLSNLRAKNLSGSCSVFFCYRPKPRPVPSSLRVLIMAMAAVKFVFRWRKLWPVTYAGQFACWRRISGRRHCRDCSAPQITTDLLMLCSKKDPSVLLQNLSVATICGCFPAAHLRRILPSCSIRTVSRLDSLNCEKNLITC